MAKHKGKDKSEEPPDLTPGQERLLDYLEEEEKTLPEGSESSASLGDDDEYPEATNEADD